MMTPTIDLSSLSYYNPAQPYSSPAWNYLTGADETAKYFAQKAEQEAKAKENAFLGNLEWGWRSTVGGGTRPESYAFTFNSPEGYYTFVPDSIIERGVSTPSGNTYWFPELLKENNLKEFFKDAKRVDFTNVPDKQFGGTYSDYFVNETNVSPTGYLIPGQSARFDSQVQTAPTESLGGGITGLGKDKSGNLVYTLNSGFINQNNETTIRRPQSTNWFQDLTGGIVDLFTSLGPIAPFLLNLAAPGIGTAISVGLNLGRGNIEGAITSGVMGAMSSGIASVLKPELTSAFAEAGLDPAATKLLTDVTAKSLTSGTIAALTGGDVSNAMQNAALNAGIGSLMPSGNLNKAEVSPADSEAPAITFTPDFAESLQSAAQQAGYSEADMQNLLQDLGAAPFVDIPPTLVREPVYPDFASPQPEPAVAPVITAMEPGEREPIAGVEDLSAPQISSSILEAAKDAGYSEEDMQTLLTDFGTAPAVIPGEMGDLVIDQAGNMNVTEPPYTPGEDAQEFIPPYTPGEDAQEFAPPYTPGEDAQEFKPPYTPGEDAEEFAQPDTGDARWPSWLQSLFKGLVSQGTPVNQARNFAQGFIGTGSGTGMGTGIQSLAMLGPTAQPFYSPVSEFDITKAFSPTLYAMQQEESEDQTEEA